MPGKEGAGLKPQLLCNRARSAPIRAGMHQTDRQLEGASMSVSLSPSPWPS